MREIKFRVLAGGRLFDVDQESDYCLVFGNEKPILQIFSAGGDIIEQIEVEDVLQFTGQKDRDGNEICEGDIVWYDDGYGNVGNGFHRVVYKGGEFINSKDYAYGLCKYPPVVAGTVVDDIRKLKKKSND